MTEHDIQKSYFKWLFLKYRDVYDLTFAVPNGGERNARVGAKLKAEGVKAGVPDVFVAVPRRGFHGLFMEIKTEKGRPTRPQLEWLERLGSQGYAAMLCKGLPALIDTTDDYLS